MRIDEVIKLSNRDTSRADTWIKKVYAKYPNVWQNNHVMLWGEGDDQQLAMFELEPSNSKENAVEVKWFQAYPQKQGVGARAMKELQALAKEDGIALTLYPWDRGRISQSGLIKFYKKQGFAPTTKGSKNMAWEPISESLSRIAFHYTNNKTALSILKSGVFQLSSTLGSVEQQYAPKGHPYFLSTTRTRRGGYHRTIGQQATLFVLNGDWFNNHYISKSIDYWENRNPSLPHHREHEAEDRVFSKTPAIPIDGVSAIHVYCDIEADPEVKAWTRQAIIAAKTRNILTYFYTDLEAWRNFDTRRLGDISILKGKERTGGYVSRHRGYLMPWIELISAKDKSQLSKNADKIRYSLQYTYDKDSVAINLTNDLSNSRKPNSGADRAHAVKIIKFMQQNNLPTIRALVDALAAKWKSN